MPITRVITSFSSEGYLQYGHKCVESFRRFWPSDVELFCYYEGKCPDGVKGADLLEVAPCKAFLARHKDDLSVRGKVELPGKPWNPIARRKGYSWRHDAYKFARKVFAISDYVHRMGSGQLYWIDADVETIKPITHDFLDSMLPSNFCLSGLYRKLNQVEVSFVGFNLDWPGTREFVRRYERQYTDDLFLKDNVWDDGWQFTLLAKKMNIPFYRIPHTSEAYPFDHSALAEYMVHRKGRRKYPKGAVVDV